jgi:hypothetical protein
LRLGVIVITRSVAVDDSHTELVIGSRRHWTRKTAIRAGQYSGSVSAGLINQDDGLAGL